MALYDQTSFSKLLLHGRDALAVLRRMCANEIDIPVDKMVYTALLKELNLKDAGYYALDALRIEAGRRAWAAELGPDETPFEAGLSYAVKLDKPADFMGKSALLKLRGQPLRKKLLTVVLGSAQHYAWGGEALIIGGQAVGELSSGG